MADSTHDSIVEIQDHLGAITDYANAIAMAAHGMTDENERAGMSRLAIDIIGHGEKAITLASRLFRPGPCIGGNHD